jgi:pimeloyl-ACP methyl ester carboxylesterase
VNGTSIAIRVFQSALLALAYIAPTVSGRIATRIWFTPVLWSKTKPRPIPDGAETVRFVRKDGDVVTGYRTGHGDKKALLVHGWAGSTRQYRQLAAALVADGHECVVIDLPGHGPAAGSQTDVVDMADAIIAAADSLGPLNLLVAHSLGAISAARALHNGAHVDAFVLIAPGVFPRRAFQQFCSLLHLRAPVAAIVERNMDDRFGEGVFDRAGLEMLESTVPDRTLIVHDIDDEMVPVADARRLAQAWEAPIVEVSGYGHNGVLSAPETIKLVVEFASGRVQAPSR